MHRSNRFSNMIDEGSKDESFISRSDSRGSFKLKINYHEIIKSYRRSNSMSAF